MTPRLAVVAAAALGATIGALVGSLVFQPSPTGYRARAVFPGRHATTPTPSVAYTARVLTGEVDPFRHTSVQTLERPPRVVVTATQLVDSSARLEANGVLEAFAWRVAAARWRAKGTLAIGEFDAGTDGWEHAPPVFVTPPATAVRDPRGVGARPGSLAFTCGAARCGTWARVFARFRRGRTYIASAALRARGGRARLVFGVPEDSRSSPRVSRVGWREVSVSWRPRADEQSAEVAVSTSGGDATYFVDRVRVADRSVPARGIARRPIIRLATTSTALHASRIAGLVIGALCGVLIVSGGAFCALLAVRVRDSDREAQQQPHT